MINLGFFLFFVTRAPGFYFAVLTQSIDQPINHMHFVDSAPLV